MLRLPLRLHDARVIAQEGAPKLPEFRFQGRYERQYDVTAGVDFGRAPPPPRLRRLADRVLRDVVFPGLGAVREAHVLPRKPLAEP